MIRALREMTVEGIKTTIPFHLEVLADPTFRSGRYSTSFVEHFMERREALPKNPSKDPEAED